MPLLTMHARHAEKQKKHYSTFNSFTFVDAKRKLDPLGG